MKKTFQTTILGIVKYYKWDSQQLSNEKLQQFGHVCYKINLIHWFQISHCELFSEFCLGGHFDLAGVITPFLSTSFDCMLTTRSHIHRIVLYSSSYLF